MLNTLTRGMLVGLLMCTGCFKQPVPQEVSLYRPGDANPAPIKAPFKGVFYLVKDPGHFYSEGKLQADLRKGDLVGFRLLPSGQLEAVAGSRSLAIEPHPYMWIGTPAHGDLNRGKTLITAAIVAGAVVGVVGMVLFVGAWGNTGP